MITRHCISAVIPAITIPSALLTSSRCVKKLPELGSETGKRIGLSYQMHTRIEPNRQHHRRADRSVLPLALAPDPVDAHSRRTWPTLIAE